jgi:hypothetical protein
MVNFSRLNTLLVHIDVKRWNDLDGHNHDIKLWRDNLTYLINIENEI